MTRYQLSLEAENLPNQRWRRASVAYASVHVSAGPDQGKVIGRTESCVGRRIQWTKTLYVETDPSVYMPLSIRVFQDSGLDDSDPILGEMTAEATAIVQSVGHRKSEKTGSGVIISASMEESFKGNKFGTVRLHLRGLDIKNVEPGLLGLGRSDPFFTIAKKNLDTAAGVVKWVTVYRSEHIMNHLNPFWKPFSLDLEELCYCDENWALKISVFDWNAGGKHALIGSFETTLQLLMDNVAVKGNADRDAAFDILKEGTTDTNLHTTKGLVVVIKADYMMKEAPMSR